jgi:hypothetical protein
VQVNADHGVWIKKQRMAAASGTGWHAMLMSSEARTGQRARSSLGFAERKCQGLEFGISLPATAGAGACGGAGLSAGQVVRSRSKNNR